MPSEKERRKRGFQKGEGFMAMVAGFGTLRDECPRQWMRKILRSSEESISHMDWIKSCIINIFGCTQTSRGTNSRANHRRIAVLHSFKQ